MRPDPDRLGGIGWLLRTNGALTRDERLRLIPAMLAGHTSNAVGRLRLLAGLRPDDLPDLAREALVPPDSRLAREAEEACREQSPPLVGHSLRTWYFGTVLAQVDHQFVDPEQFYVACLLHDTGLATPVAGEDFTVRSARRAQRCLSAAGAAGSGVESVMDAISVHTLPGVTVTTDGALGTYLQAGAMLDLTSMRAWDVPAELVDDVRARYPREGLATAISEAVGQERAAVPDGRFSYLVRWGFLLAVRMG